MLHVVAFFRDSVPEGSFALLAFGTCVPEGFRLAGFRDLRARGKFRSAAHQVGALKVA